MQSTRTLALIVIGALSAAAAAVSAILGQPLDGLALLLAAGPLAVDPAALAAAVERLSTKAEQTLGDLKDRQQTLQGQVSDLAQRMAEPDLRGPMRSPQHRSARAGAIFKAISEADGLRALQSNALRRLDVSVPGLQCRAAMTGATISAPADRDSTVYGALRPRSTLLDLLPRLPTSLGAVEYLRNTVTGLAAVQQVEGDVKAEVSFGFELETARVVTIAAWTPASRQILDDLAGLNDFIATTLLDALDAAVERQVLIGSGLPGNVHGLIPQATPYARAQPGDLPIDTLRRAITQLQMVGGQPTGMVLHPVDLEALELTRDAEGRFLLELDVADATGATRVWRVPAVTHAAVDEGEFLLGDFERSTRLYDREQGAVRISTEHEDYFVRNLVAVLAELRVALTVPRPELLVAGALTPA